MGQPLTDADIERLDAKSKPLTDADIEAHEKGQTANTTAVLTRMASEQNQPTGAAERFSKGFGGTVAGVVDSAQFVHPDEMVAAATSLKDGDYLGALHHALRAGPAKQVEDAIRSHVEQGAKAIADYKAGRNSEAVGHAVAAVIPIAGPMAANLADQATGEPAMPPGQQVDQPHPPDIAGAFGSATAIGAMGLAPKVGGLASKATPSRLVRAAEVIRHPVRTAVAAGLDMAAEAMKHKNAAVINPPALPVQPVAVATPPALPPPALPPQAPTIASNGLPVRPPLRPAVEPPSVAIQPPIEPFDAAGNRQANTAADVASGVKSKSGLISMLERRKILTIGDKALLAKLKAEVAAEQPPSISPEPSASDSSASTQPYSPGSPASDAVPGVNTQGTVPATPAAEAIPASVVPRSAPRVQSIRPETKADAAKRAMAEAMTGSPEGGVIPFKKGSGPPAEAHESTYQAKRAQVLADRLHENGFGYDTAGKLTPDSLTDAQWETVLGKDPETGVQYHKPSQETIDQARVRLGHKYAAGRNPKARQAAEALANLQ